MDRKKREWIWDFSRTTDEGMTERRESDGVWSVGPLADECRPHGNYDNEMGRNKTDTAPLGWRNKQDQSHLERESMKRQNRVAVRRCNPVLFA